MRAAGPLLPEACFVRRVITRPKEPNEEHEPVSQAEFERRERDGGFAVTWRAHGLAYGIPATVQEQVDFGELVIVNGSRRALEQIVRAFPRVATIEITAGTATRAARLAARGREKRADIERRLAREVPVDRRYAPLRVANDATVDEAAHAFAKAVRTAVSIGRRSGPATSHSFIGLS